MKYTKIFTLALIGLSVGACDIDQTEEGELPDVDVEAGEMPAYDVDVADVDVGTVQDTVVIDKPVIDVDMPDDDTLDLPDDTLEYDEGNR